MHQFNFGFAVSLPQQSVYMDQFVVDMMGQLASELIDTLKPGSLDQRDRILHVIQFQLLHRYDV